MTTVALGIKAKIYENTSGDFDAPTYSEIKNTKDRTLGLSKSESDVSISGGGGWGMVKGALKEVEVSFAMVNDLDDADVVKFFDAWGNDTLLDLLVLDEVVTSAGRKGIHAFWEVLSIEFGQGDEDAQKLTITIKPGYAPDNPPELVKTT